MVEFWFCLLGCGVALWMKERKGFLGGWVTLSQVRGFVSQASLVFFFGHLFFVSEEFGVGVLGEEGEEEGKGKFMISRA